MEENKKKITIFDDEPKTKTTVKDVKQAKAVKSSGIGSIVREIKRDNKHTPEDKEDLALLCDHMHFDAKEAYKLLRTNVLFTLPDTLGCRTICVSSPIRGEGKSTVSINLAYTFAATKARVLLIDMDMRLPSIAKKLKVDAGLGLSDYLIGNAKRKDIIRPMEGYDNWDVIYAGSIPPTPAELIGSENMEVLLSSLKKMYDFIIIDLPPVNVVSDALVAKDLCDGYVVTVRESYSDKHSLADCIRQLEFLNCNILGFVMTDSTGNSGTYGKKYTRYNRYYRKRKYGYYKNKYNYYYKSHRQ